MIYIGQTIRSFKERFTEHLRDPPNAFFREAVKYYLDKNINLRIIYDNDISARTEKSEFIGKVIHYARNQEELDKLEITEIKKRKCCVLDYYIVKENKIIPLYGYNLQRGGPIHKLSFTFKKGLSFKNIEEESLKNLIIDGYFLSEISREFRVPDIVILFMIQKFWGNEGVYSLMDARRKFGGWKKYLSRVKYVAFKQTNNISTEIVKKFIELVKYGDSTAQLKLKLDISHSELYNILYSLGFNTFTEMRDSYGVTEVFNKKYKIKHLQSVRRGDLHSYYIPIIENSYKILIEKNNDYVKIAKALSIRERTVYKKSYELLGFSLPVTKRIYYLYPKIEKQLLKNKEKGIKVPLISQILQNGLSVEEIDAEILKLIINLGYKKKDAEKLFEWNHFKMTRWVKKTLKMNWYRAKDEYWWKPRLIYLFKLGYSARQMRIASKNLIGQYVTHEIITRIWNKEYKTYGSKLFRYLKKKYFI